MVTEIKPGDTAPDFQLPDQDGNIHKLSDLRGKPVVL
jgi:thioredoxin-dependent peroxiredoxin